MNDEERKKIEEIMSKMQCPKDFMCAEHGFERLCQALDFRLDEYLVCREEDPLACPFAVSFGHDHFCRCPLRVFLAKKLKK